MDWSLGADAAGRIVLAALLGAAVGFERERDGHAAGTRTFATVAMGAAIFGVVSTLGFEEFAARRAESNVQIDVTRVASQVVVGIGFLGAGLIFRQGGTVQNLTTAATLWTTAAVGLTAGVGDAGAAVLGASVVLVVLAVLPIPLQVLLRVGRPPGRKIEVALAEGAYPDALDASIGHTTDLEVRRRTIAKRDGRLVVSLKVRAAREEQLDAIVEGLVRNDAVHALEVVSG